MGKKEKSDIIQGFVWHSGSGEPKSKKLTKNSLIFAYIWQNNEG